MISFEASLTHQLKDYCDHCYENDINTRKQSHFMSCKIEDFNAFKVEESPDPPAPKEV